MSGEVVAKQNRYIRRLRKAEAYSPDRAVSLADLRMRPGFVLRGLIKRGVVIEAGEDRYYLDRDRTEEFLERRRQIILWMAVIAVIAMMIGLLLARSAEARQQPPPIIDMHLHALEADAQGPPPMGFCPSHPGGFPAWDQRRPYAAVFLEGFKSPPCADPIWSPATDDELMTQTLEILRRRNIVGVTSGSLTEKYRAAAPDRIIPGQSFFAGQPGMTAADLRGMVTSGRVKVLGEVTNQYQGIEPDAAAFEPYLALAEEFDVPVGLHVGTGPPGAIYLGSQKYRARMHSPLGLEEPLVRHPKLRVWVMHAGWPMIDDMLAVMWAHPQVYVDTGIIVYALPRAEFYRYLQRLVEAGFGKRVMFGSDQMVWPGAIEFGIRAIEEAPFLNAGQKRDILYNNAARFLRLDGAK
jgi:predicted TIM-barrel fold metal-dependent hydrolase